MSDIGKINRLETENAILKHQLEKTVKVIGIICNNDEPYCPGVVDLPEERCTGICRECWQKALDTIGDSI